MDVDTILVTLAHLPPTVRKHVHDLVTFANAVDSAVSLLDSGSSRHSSSANLVAESDLLTTSSSASNNPANAKQTDLSKSIMSLRRLYLCFSDLIDLLESCAETLDDTKRKSLYSQIEPSVGLVRNTLNEIRDRYYGTLESRGVHLAFSQIFSCLDSFVTAIHQERENMKNMKQTGEHPNILLVLVSGVSFRDVQESIQRYIPRSDVFPCDDRPLPIPSFVESDLSDSYMKPSSPGLLDWDQVNESGSFGLQLDGEEDVKTPIRRRPMHSRSNSPSIGKPVKYPNIAHFAHTAVSLPNHYSAAGGECPGRATVLTGQLPPVHGVRTSLEKTGARSELKVDEVPTMGHYLAQSGYDVVYKGEWGLSEVQAFQEHPLLDLLGVERDTGEDLQPFGFQGWEAHCGGDWYQRSLQTTSEALEYVRRRQSVMSAQSLRGSQPPPWALVVSYPDIMPNLAEANDGCQEIVERDNDGYGNDCYVSGSFSFGSMHDMRTIRQRGRSGRVNRNTWSGEAPEDRPAVQKQFMEHCERVVKMAVEEQYEDNAKRLDQMLGELLQEVLRSDGGDTVIVLTSVNGNCEGDHGVWGCCYNAYNQSIHVPCLIFVPTQFYSIQRTLQQHAVNSMTSSIDILPSILAMASVDANEMKRVLAATHKKVPTLVGQNLCECGKERQLKCVYYQNEDVAMPLPRASSFSVLSSVFEESQACREHITLKRSVAAIITQIQDETEDRCLKLCYYSSDPRSCAYLQTGKEDTSLCEWECYDLTNDPEEMRNLCYCEQEKPVVERLKTILRDQYTRLCVLDSEAKENKAATRFSLFHVYCGDRKSVKWQQFYVLVLALVVSAIAILVPLFVSMDVNEINLDDLDNSDISSGWNSSEDEAPAMEVESDNQKDIPQPVDYERANEEIHCMESDDDPEGVPRTEHEISMDKIEVEEYNIDPTLNMLLVRAGIVSHVLDCSYIIDAGQNAKAIEENTILFHKSMEPVGRIMEVFGQVEHPYYVLRWPKSREDPHLTVGDSVYMNNADVHFILPAQLNTLGTDASNYYDEEPSEKERVMIECTEDVKGDEVPDESGLTEVNYQQDYVIPSEAPYRVNASRIQSVEAVQISPPVSQDTSGMDILRNSYF